MEKLKFWLECLRAYSMPMSIFAWSIPFAYGCFHKGNIAYGLLALIGIICVHLGANLFDDIIDFKKYSHTKEKTETINLKKGKCRLFLENKISIKKAFFVAFMLFGISLLIGAFFISIYKLPIVLIILLTAILSLIYPFSGYFAMSEIIIGTIFSPLLFTGVYYVMTGSVSKELELLSVSFVLVTVTLLYTDFFLDYNSDKLGGKKTLPIILGCKHNAYYFYIFMIFLIYANLFVGIHSHIFPMKYSWIFLSVIAALTTIKTLQNYIYKEIKDDKEFFLAMNNVQKFISIFAILCIISFV